MSKFPTSYIPTTTTAVTREADLPIVPSATMEGVINPYSGTLYFELFSYGTFDGIQRGIFLSDDSSVNESFGFNFSSSVLTFVSYDAVQIIQEVGAIPVGVSRVAVSYDVGGSYYVALNGSIGATGTFSGLTTSRILGLGNRGGSVSGLVDKGTYRDVKWYPRALTQTELEDMTR